MNLEGKEFLLAIDSNSIAGYVALTGKPLLIDDVYALTGKEEYRFNYEYDKNNNYYSKSMLVIPMKNHRDEVIGVLQLINKKRDPEKKNLTIDEMKGDEVVPFTQKCLELVLALGGASRGIDRKQRTLNDISNLFEGFVKASVTAIEQRDPTTSGHSFRVAEYTVALAQVIDGASNGIYSSRKIFTRSINGNSLRLVAPRFRKGWSPGKSPCEGEETLRTRVRADPVALSFDSKTNRTRICVEEAKFLERKRRDTVPRI